MEFFTKENITLLVSILGACAWIPIVMEKLCVPQIECKIRKYDWLEHGSFQYCIPFENGLKREINGTIYVIGMRLISRNNDFHVSDVKVQVKFESMSNEKEAYVHYSPSFHVKNQGKDFEAELNKNVLFCPVLKKDEINDLEIHFIVECDKTDVEYIKFIFVNAKGKEKVVIAEKEDFKYALKTFN